MKPQKQLISPLSKAYGNKLEEICPMLSEKISELNDAIEPQNILV
jgi:hypothetical protein